MSIANLTPSQLRQAADLKEKIVELENQLAAITGTQAAPAQATKPAKKGMSAAGRAKVAAAQKARWAKIIAAKGKTAPKAKPVKKARKISAEGIARIKAAQKARWEKIKAAKPTPATPVTAKSAPVKPAAPKPAKKKFKMSAAAKAKLSALMKARWAAKKVAVVKK